MNLPTNMTVNDDFSSIVSELNFPDIKNQDDFIRYVMRIYGERSFYAPYKPKLIYIVWCIYFIALIGLIYIGINGALADNSELQKGFHELWIKGSNLLYFFIIMPLFPVSLYTLIREKKERSLIYIIVCILYHLFFFIGIFFSLYSYFKKGFFFQKQWAINSLKLTISIFIVPLTWYFGRIISNLI